MAARLALLCVIIEIGALAYGLYVPSERIFYKLAVYGSPIHLMMYAVGAHAALLSSTRQYLQLLLFHVVKYGFFIKAKVDDEVTGSLIAAMIGEAAYLAYCGYILYR